MISLLWKNLWSQRPGAALDSAYNSEYQDQAGLGGEEVKGPGRRPSFCKCELGGTYGSFLQLGQPSSYLEAETTTELAELTQVVTSGKGWAEPTVPWPTGAPHTGH